MRVAAPSAPRRYPYGGTAYANPHAVTQIANGLSTTTFTYDNNGNVTQKTTDGTTTTYVWDYANRLTALGVLGATTTYGYDAFGNRVLQTGTSTTYIYPNKWYSIASSTGSGAKYATTTEYVFNGDTLLATIDRQLAGGVATGTAITRYVHPDHLGSANVVTDENGNLVQTLDYYPYGSTRVSVATSTNEKRQFIGQFTDDSTLSYLNNRYYQSDRGQFISEDPVFWEMGLTKDGKAALANPQAQNSYAYANDNPITRKDPTGRGIEDIIGEAAISVSEMGDRFIDEAVSEVESYGKAGSNGQATEEAAPNFFRIPSPETLQASLGLQEPIETAPITWRVNTPLIFSGSLSAALLWLIGDQRETYRDFVGDIQPFKGLASYSAGSATNKNTPIIYSPQFNQSVQAIQNGTTVQARASAVNNFNAATGAAAPQSKLWVTPSGAVVTWGGQVVSGPVSNQK
jgi:RHS repeat-associated protein